MVNWIIIGLAELIGMQSKQDQQNEKCLPIVGLELEILRCYAQRYLST